METSRISAIYLTFIAKLDSRAYYKSTWRVKMCIFCSALSTLIIIQRLKWCHFLQTSVFCCEVRGQAQAVAACLCLHCLLLI